MPVISPKQLRESLWCVARKMAARADSTTAVIIVERPTAFWRLGGRSLVERLGVQLSRVGATRIMILYSPEFEGAMRREQRVFDKQWETCSNVDDTLDRKLGIAGGKNIVVVSASAVFDDRLLELALKASSPSVFVDSAAVRDCAHLPIRDGCCPLGMAVVAKDFLIGERDRVLTAACETPTFKNTDINDLPHFWPSQRRNLRPYWVPVTSPESFRRARRCVVYAASKGHQEWPVIIFNRPVETAISWFLSETPITPNQITLISMLTGLAAGILLAYGQIAWGLVACFSTMVLDGLDGRQARVQVRFSRFGELEHVGDKLVEIGWIAGLGWHLSSTAQSMVPLWGAAAWIAFVFVNNFSGSFYRKRVGILPDLASGVDAFIRLIAPRRNINVVFLAVGSMVGQLPLTFWAIIVASGIFTVIHWVRVLILLRSPPDAPWLAGKTGSRYQKCLNALFGAPTGCP